MNVQISKAMDAHALWKEKLVAAIESGYIDKTVDEIKVDNNCAFGKWLYGNELSEEIKHSDGYLKVQQIHSEFHHIAARIAELAIFGDKQAALDLLHDAEYSSVTMNLNNALYYMDKLL
jgi:hypothetical protein